MKYVIFGVLYVLATIMFWAGYFVGKVAEREKIKEVKQGSWVKKYPEVSLDGEYYCSVCKESIDIGTGEETPLDREMFYCMNCGANLKG